MITNVGNPDIGSHGHAPFVEIEHSELGNPENILMEVCSWENHLFSWEILLCKNNQMVTFSMNMADISTAISGFRHRFDP